MAIPLQWEDAVIDFGLRIAEEISDCELRTSKLLNGVVTKSAIRNSKSAILGPLGSFFQWLYLNLLHLHHGLHDSLRLLGVAVLK
jgi:hypothetical protein